MAQAAPAQARYVATEISYLAADSAGVNRRFAAPGIEVNTGTYRMYPVKVRDARPERARITLDSHGFELIDHQSAVKDFFDKDEVDRLYQNEVAEAIKALTGATRVAAHGWMIRSADDMSKYQRPTTGYKHQGGVQPPAADAHIDYLPDIAERQAKAHYERAYPGGPGYKRFIAGSFWRSFSEPPQDWPLALCEGGSVAPTEGVRNTLIVVDKIPSREEMLAPIPDEDSRPSAAIFRFNPEHRWWYFPNMTRDEALFFKFHDSDRSTAWRVPHTAFKDTSFANAKPRMSIECRAIAYFE